MDKWALVKANIREGMADDELREAVRPLANGEYVTKICRRCGMFWTSPAGSLREAKVVDRCRECFEDDYGQTTD